MELLINEYVESEDIENKDIEIKNHKDKNKNKNYWEDVQDFIEENKNTFFWIIIVFGIILILNESGSEVKIANNMSGGDIPPAPAAPPAADGKC